MCTLLLLFWTTRTSTRVLAVMIVTLHGLPPPSSDHRNRDFQGRNKRLGDVGRMEGVVGGIVPRIGPDRPPGNGGDIIAIVVVDIASSRMRRRHGLWSHLQLWLHLNTNLLLLGKVWLLLCLCLWKQQWMRL